MNMKKKILTTSLAATLAVGSVASLPLSSQGLLEQLGIGTANASATTPLPSSAAEIKITLNEIYAELSPTDKEVISAARDKVLELQSTAGSAETQELINPIWDLVLAKINSLEGFETATSYNTVNKENLFLLVSHLAIQYDPDYKDLEALRTNSELRPVLNDLAKLGGLTTGMDEVDFADFITFAKELQNAAINSITSATSVTDLLNAKETAKTAIKNVLNASETKTATALRSIGITDEALLATKANFEKVTGPDADRVFATAYLKVLIKKLPSAPTGGGGGAPANDVSGPDKAKATEALTKVAEKLAELLKDKGHGIAKALEAIQEALRKAATIDLSKTVKVEGDKATFAVDATKLGDVFKTVKELAATANEKLKAAGSAKTVKVIATLDLGNVNSKNVELPLTKEILEAAKANGIEALALKVNGVELTLDLDQLGSGTTITIKKQDKSAAPASKLSVASDVYDFTFVSGGSDVGNFDKPVEVRLPVTVDGLDSELLVFAKIADGKLIFKGGKYDADKKTFVVPNKSFSTYAVVENKISFNDTDAVKDWAGRQIAVAAAKGILEGREEGQFVPNGKVTRAEFAKLVVKAFGVEDAKATETFADVNTSDWFQPYVAAAAKAGLIEGRSAESFEPNAPITRAELATIASRALSKLKDYQAVEKTDTTLAAFQDAASIQTSLKDGVALAAEQGIVIGEDGGKFNPNDDSTRAQAAVVIYRLLNK